MKQSKLELLFEQHLIDWCAPVASMEYHFCEGRQWRFDFAWPHRKVAVEIEGGVWSGGRHTRGAGFIADCEKYNTAAMLGWRVFRFPGGVVENGDAIAFMARVFEAWTP